MTSNKDGGPAPCHVSATGERWWNWCYEYDWGGSTYGFEIAARSKEEADARLKRLPLARYVGQQDGNDIPYGPGVGLWVRLKVWWRNTFLAERNKG